MFGTILPLLRFSHVYVTVGRDGEVEPSMESTPDMVAVFEAKWFGLGNVFMIGDPKPVPEAYR